jgi:hypothetical protein
MASKTAVEGNMWRPRVSSGMKLQKKGVDDVLTASDRAWFHPISGR